ncbi:hypothetical protein H257_00021 [Aphanomyces astaci]|uniref:Calcineurin-like phosphoesterase domain-containing protein n=2 Tax=Aphanomyces astaci TaxID=112090 RepID=W4H9Z1_APHAT|nr:hypothetical protein H257_00021 [Aphanomyces astaci]ETV88391.1 hypothetical protein H257_00021 [Aphanomyces astaci]RQM29506.1 hypothetical protein B5M09_012246 [Aphanomyces astaci]|eukprot:XP_009820791.1 hypothetical protein H257_00021 [Aphanomyces astaci]
MKWRAALFVAAAAVSSGVTLWLCSTLYYQYIVHSCGSQAMEGGGTRVVVVSDAHMLGHRKRSTVERLWVDWQAWLSFTTIVSRRRPDLIVFLGDQFDEGTAATNNVVHKEYIARFREIFDPNVAQSLHLLGNHDAAFGPGLTAPLVGRHEREFGPANRVVNVNNVLFLQLNTMALESDVLDQQVHHDAMAYDHPPYLLCPYEVSPCPLIVSSRRFLDSVEEKRRSTGFPPLVLLTHLPLYRPDDLACGAQRAAESGHITYEAPSFKYTERHHVLSKALSERLLATIRPVLVLSGHSHATCAHAHRVHYQPHPVQEYTIPTFSWGMRPDPSFAILTVLDTLPTASKDDPSSVGLHLATCSLPRESHFVAVLVLAAGLHASVAWVIYSHLWPSRPLHSPRND